MSENRMKILEMLAAGQITADEAERLIAALEKERASSSSGSDGEEPKPRPQYLRVQVEADGNRHGDKGPHKVNIRVPMRLLRAGVKLASLVPVHFRDHVNEALKKEGVTVDLSQIKPENLEELIEQLDDVTVDVGHENHRAKVMVFCE